MLLWEGRRRMWRAKEMWRGSCWCVVGKWPLGPSDSGQENLASRVRIARGGDPV